MSVELLLYSLGLAGEFVWGSLDRQQACGALEIKPGGSSKPSTLPRCITPGEEPEMGLRILTPVGETRAIIILQFVHSTLEGMGVDYIINCPSWLFCCSVHSSCTVMSNSLQPHGLQQARLPCPSPTPGAYSCSSSQWCHPIIPSSSVPFSSCLQSFPA